MAFCQDILLLLVKERGMVVWGGYGTIPNGIVDGNAKKGPLRIVIQIAVENICL
jgi:hypothetical protein